MKIGIEAQRIFRSNKHGMDYVVLEEIKQLQELDKHNEYFVFVKPGPDHCLQSTFNCHVIEVDCPSYPLWEQYALPRAARRCGVELLHCTSNTAPIFCKIPMVLTLHDIIFLEPRDKQNKSVYQNLGWLYRRLVVPRIIDRCRQIITVSNFEKENIISKLGLPDTKVTMIYNGYNEWFKPVVDKRGVVEKYIADKDYFFFLGNTDPKKNSERTILAYAKYLSESEVGRRLLVADLKRNEIDEILRRNGLMEISDKIVSSGYIANKDLPYIYSKAFAFLYTSLRESFGIPLLEGMACGTAVITSNTSSMPEIAGHDAALVSPDNIEEMAAMMLKMERDENFRRETIEKGLRRVEMFSWKKNAGQLLDVYTHYSYS